MDHNNPQTFYYVCYTQALFFSWRRGGALAGGSCCENRGVEESPAAADTFYDRVGGHATFVALVDRFYQGVAADPLLRPMYPEEDLARERLTLFLEQYWGGPTTYSQQRGHPRLRMRHAPFVVDATARDQWLAHMRAAVVALHLPPILQSQLWDYLERAAWSWSTRCLPIRRTRRHGDPHRFPVCDQPADPEMTGPDGRLTSTAAPVSGPARGPGRT